MKFSYNWLGELLPGLDTDPARLQHLITVKTAECEGIEPFGAHFANVIAVRVLSVQPSAKGKNKIVLIDAGHGRNAQVICGAPNVNVGMTAAWVPPGTVLDGKKLNRAVIDGVESEGMLASAAELGISRDHSGLLELDGVAPGTPVPRLRPDWIIEIDNKSLTHRPDLWGHFGMAREVAAIAGGALRDPVDLSLLPTGDAPLHVRIADHELCPVYSALVFENVRVEPSPLWLQARLESVGINPINNIVDVTNYVLAELPQPMHAFDADKLVGDTIMVRFAWDGERMAALNGESYALTRADLVIADRSGPVALAGVIGGQDSAISHSTKRIVLESANFQPTTVRLSGARHKLRTDASMRFEKSLDPENTRRGLARALELFQRVCPGICVVGGVAQSASTRVAPPVISLPITLVTRKLGKVIEAPEVLSILSALGFGVIETEPAVLSVTVPSWRATKDISLKEDLVEEVGRIIGYDEIAPVPPLIAAVVPPANPMRKYLRELRRQLAAQGYTETYNYSFVNPTDVKRFSMNIGEHLEVRNPIAAELSHLRRSLLPGLFNNFLGNVRHSKSFRLFEIGSAIEPQPNGLPIETTRVAAIAFDAGADEQDFFEIKRVVESAFPCARFRATEPFVYEHPTRVAEVSWAGQVIGRAFELHPSMLGDENIEGRAMCFDIDVTLAQLIAANQTKRYTPLRKYPTSGFDLSILSELRRPVDQIQDDLTRLAGPDLALIEFVRQYAGPPLPEGQKSVSYHLEIGSLQRTMTADEVTEIRNRIISGMRKLGFDLRV